MEPGRLALLLLLVGVSTVDISDCAYDNETDHVLVDDDADSVIVVEGDELGEEEEEEEDGLTAAARAEDLLREIVNYGLEQGRHGGIQGL